MSGKKSNRHFYYSHTKLAKYYLLFSHTHINFHPNFETTALFLTPSADFNSC